MRESGVPILYREPTSIPWVMSHLPFVVVSQAEAANQSIHVLEAGEGIKKTSAYGQHSALSYMWDLGVPILYCESIPWLLSHLPFVVVSQAEAAGHQYMCWKLGKVKNFRIRATLGPLVHAGFRSTNSIP